ncbi:hypothetical protein [Treponema sp. J25]|jgi:hypothetical protein|uniref:hypothetical protein n=1 Tax=Treponema sp. J25 TaxID=2094121 RepID=UPI001045563A|nr:hypothetical protein [Treponema sp. J25]TCW62096.1 hypothetical protein C5O22_03410 [Treponema sp. J25]
MNCIFHEEGRRKEVPPLFFSFRTALLYGFKKEKILLFYPSGTGKKFPFCSVEKTILSQRGILILSEGLSFFVVNNRPPRF